MIKKLNVKVVAIILVIVSIILTINTYTNNNNKLYYKEVVHDISDNYKKDLNECIDTVENILKDDDLSIHDRGTYLVTIATFLYVNKNFEEFESRFEEIELFLETNKMNEELVYLYSMITSIYTGRYEYEKAYLYIYKSEIITTLLYKDKKDEETLSTLLAIRYLKSNIALDLGLEDEADKAFNEAENLRMSENIRKRVDSYTSIATYYYKKGDFDNAKKYALETMELIGEKDIYKSNLFKVKIILAQAYLIENKLDEELENLLNDIENNYKVSGSLLADKYLVYAHFYKIKNETTKYLEYLEKAYENLREINDFRKKDIILDEIINIVDELNDEKSLIKWCREIITLEKKQEDMKNTQFLIGRVIDNDIANAEASIHILELEKKNLMYMQIILVVLITVVLIVAKRLTYINRNDALTGVYNRGYFNTLYKKYENSKDKYSLVIFDIDNFKKLNDTYGHDFGDIVLVNMAKMIKNTLPKDFKFFRYGGEEFVILVKNDDVNYAIDMVDKIREKVEQMTWKEPTTVTISLGVSFSGDENDDMLKKADDNLYYSKKNGKNRVTYK